MYSELGTPSLTIFNGGNINGVRRRVVLKKLIAQDRNALRGIFAAACAAVFLLVNVAHTFEHAAHAAAALSSQQESGVADGSPDMPDPAMADIENCHGCTTVGVAVEAQFELTADARSIVPCARAHSFSPHARAADTPPPRSIT
jgi:hypothetical protein